MIKVDYSKILNYITNKINEYYQENFDSVFARTEKALSGNRENNYKQTIKRSTIHDDSSFR